MTTEQGKPGEPRIATIKPVELKITMGTFRAQLRQDPWKEWLTISIDQCHLANAARQLEISKSAVDGDPPLRREYHAAMIALTASAHAIDGFYNKVTAIGGHVASLKDRRRHVIVRKTLRHYFADPRLDSERWKHDFAWLFADM